MVTYAVSLLGHTDGNVQKEVLSLLTEVSRCTTAGQVQAKSPFNSNKKPV
jgi:hypothetical protein